MIPLNAAALESFEPLRAAAAKRGLAAPDHCIFPARDPVTRQLDPTLPAHSWRSAWRSLTRKAGLAGLPFHDLRHLAITELSENGTPDAVVMAISGRSRQVLDRYTHVPMPAIREAVDALGFGGVTEARRKSYAE